MTAHATEAGHPAHHADTHEDHHHHEEKPDEREDPAESTPWRSPIPTPHWHLTHLLRGLIIRHILAQGGHWKSEVVLVSFNPPAYFPQASRRFKSEGSAR